MPITPKVNLKSEQPKQEIKSDNINTEAARINKVLDKKLKSYISPSVVATKSALKDIKGSIMNTNNDLKQKGQTPINTDTLFNTGAASGEPNKMLKDAKQEMTDDLEKEKTENVSNPVKAVYKSDEI